MKPFKKLWKTFVNRETILYVVFGVCTTIINFVVAKLSYQYLPIPSPVALTAVSNVLAWLLAVIFAFITNKLFVFQSKSTKRSVLLYEILTFFAARLASLGVDLVGMILLVDVVHWNYDFSKILMNVLVIIINYVLSKRIIFKRANASPSTSEKQDKFD